MLDFADTDCSWSSRMEEEEVRRAAAEGFRGLSWMPRDKVVSEWEISGGQTLGRGRTSSDSLSENEWKGLWRQGTVGSLSLTGASLESGRVQAGEMVGAS